MKKSIVTVSLLFIFFCVYSQNAETEIRKLENEQKEAFLKKDTITLSRLFAPGFIVNSPGNKVETLKDIYTHMRNGGTDRDSFEKEIEKITLVENIAVVMGNEVIKPTGKALHAGKTVKRRYTNIWMKSKKSWQLVARQSTIISVE